MKITFLMTGLLVLVSLSTFAQKGELNNAKDKFASYNVERANKLTMVQGQTDLNDAKTSIDKASANPKTSALPLTFALKGGIYSALALQDSIPATSLPLFTTADDALKQAKVLDSAKNENKDLIHNAYLNLAQYEFNTGRAQFQDKKYDQAYHSFDYFRQVLPDDTLSMYVTGLSAANAAMADPKFYDAAIASYTRLLTTNYSQNRAIYYDLASIYLAKKDTANAFKITGEAVAKYPTDNDLRRREIEIGLQSGKQAEMIGKIESAISNDPKNKTLYYYEGLTYSQIAESVEAQEAKTKEPVAKAALDQKKEDNFSKAAEQYKKALAIDPDYFEANLNLGYVIIKPAIDEYNAANLLPTSKQKEYDAAVAKANTEFDAAKPYLQKAVDLNPKSVDALENLKTYYLGKKDTAHANALQKQIEALGGQ
jgi:tetratricopeptide (TPR) repeat protein